MRIAYVCNEYPPRQHGGIGIFVQTIARGMAKAGHEVQVVGLGQSNSVVKDLDVNVYTLKGSGESRLAAFTSRHKLHRWLSHKASVKDIDIIEVPDFFGMLPMPFSDCPVVVRLHMTMTAISKDASQPPSRLLNLFERYTLKHHRSWIAVSRYVQDLTTKTFKLTPKLSKVIYNPFSLEPETDMCGLPKKYILFGGSVRARKGAYTLAQAARSFLPRYPDLHLVYAGKLLVEDGRSADSRIIEIVGSELKQRVHFLGYISRGAFAACLRKATVFAFPSRLEALPLVVGEAMAAGVPVVVSNTGPFPEIVTHEETGLLVPPDDPSALASSVTRLLESPSLAHDFTVRAQKLVHQRFTLEACVKDTERFYLTCLEQFGHPHFSSQG